MNYDDTDLINQGQPSLTERQVRGLMVPSPATFVTNKRLDIIHDRDPSSCGKTKP